MMLGRDEKIPFLYQLSNVTLQTFYYVVGTLLPYEPNEMYVIRCTISRETVRAVALNLTPDTNKKHMS